jgi:hypothetical protein
MYQFGRASSPKWTVEKKYLNFSYVELNERAVCFFSKTKPSLLYALFGCTELVLELNWTENSKSRMEMN